MKVQNKRTMPRTRKQQPVAPVVVTPEVKVQQVLITREQYIQDIKARWAIHTYEVNKLVEDINKLFSIITDKVYYAYTDR